MLETKQSKQGLSGNQNSKNRKIQLEQDVSISTIAKKFLNPVCFKFYKQL